MGGARYDQWEDFGLHSKSNGKANQKTEYIQTTQYREDLQNKRKSREISQKANLIIIN